MKTHSRIGSRGFTLIEMMAVITIIVILAVLVIGSMGWVTDRQAKEKARVQIGLLSMGIEAYKLDMGKYPPSKLDGNSGSTSLYVQLFYQGWDFTKNPDRPDTPLAPMATKIYLPDLNPLTSKLGWVPPVPPPITPETPPPATTTIIDPWGKEYGYRISTDADAQNPDFDLWSCGKDNSTSPGTPGAKENRDDIKNF